MEINLNKKSTFYDGIQLKQQKNNFTWNRIYYFTEKQTLLKKFEDTKGVIRSSKSKISKEKLEVVNLRYQRSNQKQ